MEQVLAFPAAPVPGRSVGPDRDQDHAAARLLASEAASLGAGLAGLVLLALAPRGRGSAQWAMAGLGASLVGAAVVGWTRREALAAETALQIVEGLHLATSPAEAYDLWRDFGRWPTVMRHVEEVRSAGDGRWTWKVRLPGLPRLEWTSEVVREEPGKALAWRTLPGSSVDHSGTVNFKALPGGRGTGVRLELDYEPPAGTVGRAFAPLFRPAAERLIRDDLRRLKSLAEAGEVPVNDMRADGPEDVR